MIQNYYKTKESVEEYIRLAKDVNGKELIDKLKLYLPSHSTLLEIGSGPGTDFEILKSRYKVTGSDYSHEFINRLKASYKDDEFLILDATTLETYTKYDGIYSNKVLHHLTDEELVKSVRRQFDILNTNGVICHSFWNGEGTETYNELFVNYQTEKSLIEIFEEHFEIIDIEEYKEFDLGDSLVLVAKKLIT